MPMTMRDNGSALTLTRGSVRNGASATKASRQRADIGSQWREAKRCLVSYSSRWRVRWTSDAKHTGTVVAAPGGQRPGLGEDNPKELLLVLGQEFKKMASRSF